MSPSITMVDALREWSEVFMHRSARDYRRFMAESGLSFTQVNFLLRIFHGDEIGVSRLAQIMKITNAAASQAVDGLVKDGLVARMENPIDRRAKCFTLTTDGKTLIERSLHAGGQWIAELAEKFTLEQQMMITEALQLLTTAARNPSIISTHR